MMRKNEKWRNGPARFLVARFRGSGYKAGTGMSTELIILLVVVAVVAAGGVVVYLRARPPAEEPVHHFNCPHCKRKLRYRNRQAGKPGACPRCRQSFTFPLAPGQAAQT
jgi:hypothetical protein